MHILSFPLCCGANILADFGNTQNALNKTKYTPKEIEDFIKNREGGNLSFSMIVLNEEQKMIMKLILRKYHYRCIGKDLFHPSHNSHLYIYIREWNKNHWRNPKIKKTI